MQKRLFGTDGIRGKANVYPMTVEMALRLGQAAASYFRRGSHPHKVLIGKDTRLSGYTFESALTAGFCSMGMHAIMVGPMPTPAISFLTRNMRADLGVVISASHNPYYDNGIKFFDSEGFKLADEVEDAITALLLQNSPEHQAQNGTTGTTGTWTFPSSSNIGRAKRIEDAGGRYIVYTKSCFPAHLSLTGIRVVIDCAHGAAYKVAPLALRELGAEVITLGTEPNGTNINDGYGSLFPQRTAEKVREVRADIGLALDGDADRLIVVDENGTILDGDQIMALCALAMLERNELPNKTVVSTVMSNMALEVFMKKHGGTLLRTKVGDRYVMEAMQIGGYMFGGEQSGHLIFRQFSTTGDGLLAALQILRYMCEKQRPLSDLAGLLTPFPQELINVRVQRKPTLEKEPRLLNVVEDIEKDLGENGRVLLRYSGTEPVCRVMVEGEDGKKVQSHAHYLAEQVKHILRASESEEGQDE